MGTYAKYPPTLPTTLGSKPAAQSIPVTLNYSDMRTLPTQEQGYWSYNVAVNNYSVTPVTTSAYVEIIPSTVADIEFLKIFDSSGRILILARGPAGSEQDVMYITPGGDDLPYFIDPGTRLSIKALDGNATTGYFILNTFSKRLEIQGY
jgi:hypothetical protein